MLREKSPSGLMSENGEQALQAGNPSFPLALTTTSGSMLPVAQTQERKVVKERDLFAPGKPPTKRRS